MPQVFLCFSLVEAVDATGWAMAASAWLGWQGGDTPDASTQFTIQFQKNQPPLTLAHFTIRNLEFGFNKFQVSTLSDTSWLLPCVIRLSPQFYHFKEILKTKLATVNFEYSTFWASPMIIMPNLCLDLWWVKNGDEVSSSEKAVHCFWLLRWTKVSWRVVLN